MNKQKIYRDPELQSKKDKLEIEGINELLKKNSEESDFNKLDNFTKYCQESTLSRFIFRYEVYKKQLNIPGVVLDFGVGRGASLFTWAKLSEIFEPINYTREIFGFDTFEGTERHTKNKDRTKKTDYSIFSSNFTNISNAVKLFDTNRKLSHIRKIHLYKGDVTKTLLKFEKENKHTLVSLLHLDLDIYKPTKMIMKSVIKRMPKGSIILFGQLSTRLYPGETLAFLDQVDINVKNVQRSPHCTTMAYLVI